MRVRPRVDEPEGPSTALCRRLAPATPWLPLQVCSNWKSSQSNQQPPEPTKQPTKSLITSDPFAETECTYRASGSSFGYGSRRPGGYRRKKREGIRGGARGSKTYRGRKGRSLDEEADLFLVASCELEVDLPERVGGGSAGESGSRGGGSREGDG
jgi:hypothetical protein